MEIKYFGLQSNLLDIMKEEVSQNHKKIYVFQNYQSMNEIKKNIKKENNIIFENYEFMHETEFYEKIFYTENILLKEEKEVVFFYNSLTKDIKEKLNVKNYFDVIDIAYNYYSLFYELNEYQINLETIELEKWQVEIFKVLKEIDDNIQNESKKRRIIVKHLLRKIENVDEKFIEKYNQIMFVNKFKYTPLEKSIMELFTDKISIIMQLDNDDFDEKNMKLRKISLPSLKDIKNNIQIIENSSKFNQMVDMLYKLQDKVDIYDVDNKFEDDYKLLNQSKIYYSNAKSFNQTRVYKIIELLSNILHSIKYKRMINGETTSEIIFAMKDILPAINNVDFRKKFHLNEVYNLFQEFAQKEYKYISKEIVNSQIEYYRETLNDDHQLDKVVNKYNKMLEFINKLELLVKNKTYKDYYEFLEDLSNYDYEDEYTIKQVYLEALSEVMTIEEFNFTGLWSDFFDNTTISSNLLKIFIKYLDKKEVELKINSGELEDIFRIKDLKSLSELNKKKLFLLNLQGNVPNVKVNNFLLTKIQRASIGLPIKEEEKLIESFLLYKNIFSSENVSLFYIKNLEEKIDSSSLISEIITTYNLNVNKSDISDDLVLSIVKDYFETNEEVKYLGNNKFYRSELIKEKELQNINLGYYQYDILKKCQYRYYLDKMLYNINIEEISEQFKANSFGNIIHRIFEEIVKKKKDDIEKNKSFLVTEEEVKEELDKILDLNIYIIPRDYLEFYKKVSFKAIVNAVMNFMRVLHDELIDKENVKITFEEKVRQKQEIKIDERVTISGIMDLHVKTSDSELLVDYKSGKVEKKDIIKALKQLDYYEIIMHGEQKENTKKLIINAWNGENVADNAKSEDRDFITKQDIQRVIDNYYDYRNYTLSMNISDCQYCNYIGICRRGDEVE